jgi:hypothetical protein
VIWLGDKRGFLSDWVTQVWVKTTGRRIGIADHPWLDGPIGETLLIGKDFFVAYAERNHLDVEENQAAGLIRDFSQLSGPCTDIPSVAAPVRDFYEHTSRYELDAWSEWHGLFKPFGHALAIIFSRRLQQLNIPLSAMDIREGMSSRILELRTRDSKDIVLTAWMRELHATRNVLYAGCYSIADVPGYACPCVKVVFPLPNGSATVLLKPEVHPDGSLTLASAGNSFGDPGFYFVVRDATGTAWARYLKTMKETIHVYPSDGGTIRTDHIFRIWGLQFLRLHYRMKTKT